MQFELFLSADVFTMPCLKLKHFKICKLRSYEQLVGLMDEVCFVKYFPGWGW